MEHSDCLNESFFPVIITFLGGLQTEVLNGLTHCHVQLHTNPDPLGKLHPSHIVDRSSPLPHPHLLTRCHPVRKLSNRSALIPTGVSRGLGAAGIWTGTGTSMGQIPLGWLLNGRFSSCSQSWS